jgi:hypothetical protein
VGIQERDYWPVWVVLLFSGNRLPLAKALVRHPAQGHAEIMRMLKRVSLRVASPE